MSKRITITHADDVSVLDAALDVYVAVKNNADRGEVLTLSNGDKVSVSSTAKSPSFYVWRTEVL